MVADVLVPVLLFVLLSPGILLTIPPTKGGLLMSRETSVYAVLAHAILFGFIYMGLRTTFPKFYR
jgi:hypothetical protein